MLAKLATQLTGFICRSFETVVDNHLKQLKLFQMSSERVAHFIKTLVFQRQNHVFWSFHFLFCIFVYSIGFYCQWSQFLSNISQVVVKRSLLFVNHRVNVSIYLKCIYEQKTIFGADDEVPADRHHVR